MAQNEHFFEVVKTRIWVSETSRIKTSDCFKEGFEYPDPDINKWLSDYIPSTQGGTLVYFCLGENTLNSMQIANGILWNNEPHHKAYISKLLVNNGKTFSLKQVEDLHRRFILGETEIGLNTNGYANLFFVHDERDNVFILDIRLDVDVWEVDVETLNNEIGLMGGLTGPNRFFYRDKQGGFKMRVV